MNLETLGAHWDAFGRSDPLWAILTDDIKRGGGWSEAEFFASGVTEVDETMAHLASLLPNLPKRSALDFGCGVGRLTQALGRHFERVCGVDIAPAMIERARQYNRLDARCQYLVNAVDHLRQFPDAEFDLVYSNITLQHMAPTYAKAYIAEFLRVLSPSGAAVFLVPDSSSGEESESDAGDPNGSEPVMEMHGIAVGDLVHYIRERGGRIVDIALDRKQLAYFEALESKWLSFWYVVTRETRTTLRFRVEATLRRVLPFDAAIVLIDGGLFDATVSLGRGWRRAPFFRRESVYVGPPEDSSAAIDELRSAQHAGASHLVLVEPAFWWQEYYREFFDYLQSAHRCVLATDELAVFALDGRPAD